MAHDDVIEAQVVDGPARDEPPVGWRELLAVILMVVLVDVTVYRGHGYAGYAALFAGLSLAVAAGSACGANAAQPAALGECRGCGNHAGDSRGADAVVRLGFEPRVGTGPADRLRTGLVRCRSPRAGDSRFPGPHGVGRIARTGPIHTLVAAAGR